MDGGKITSNFEWVFNLQDVSKVPGGQESLYSPYFFSGTKNNFAWRLELLLSLHSKFWKLHLHLLASSDADEVRVNYELSLKSHTPVGNYLSGGENFAITSVKDGKLLKIPDDCIAKHPIFYPARFFKIIFEKEQTLRICCKLEIEIIRGRCSLQHKDEGVPDFEKLLNDPEFSDITIKTSTESFEANKKILATRSPVFQAMFEHDMKEKMENTVYVPDVEADVMRELLHYIYSGRVKSFDKVSQLFHAADKYQLDGLRFKCLEVLCDGITLENAVEILVLASSCSDEKSTNRIISYIVDNIQGILASSSLDSLHDVSLVRKILHETVVRRMS